MASFLRALVVYAFLFTLFRIAGRRTLAQTTTFDLVLALIVSEGVSQALHAGDTSLANAAIISATLIGVDMLLARAKVRWPSVERALEGEPVTVAEHGRVLPSAKRHRIERDDILEAARSAHGIDGLERIERAVLERDGTISIIPTRTMRD